MCVRPRVGLVVLALLAGGVGVACAHRAGRQPAGSSPTTPGTPGGATTAPAVTLFSRPDLGVELVRPVGWVEEPSADFVMLLRPAASGAAVPRVSLDVPALPFHIPGMIPIGSVRSGYLDDLRKQVGVTATEDLPPPEVGGATARLVRSTWQAAGGRAFEETALLLVHGDRVYILRAQADEGSRAAARAAFDDVVKSIRWVRQGK